MKTTITPINIERQQGVEIHVVGTIENGSKNWPESEFHLKSVSHDIDIVGDARKFAMAEARDSILAMIRELTRVLAALEK